MGEERKKAAASLMSFSRLRNPVYKIKKIPQPPVCR